MLDLIDHPVIEKSNLIGFCSRLSIAVDLPQLQKEILGLPASTWGNSGGRVGVHSVAMAAFLRGFAPAEGDRPIEDRQLLHELPYTKYCIEHVIPGLPQRCLLAKLPGGRAIAAHIDRAPYFAKTVRIHIPIFTHERAWMICGDLTYQMKAGEVWALNNNALHAVVNDDIEDRTHLICDVIPTAATFAVLAAAERNLGIHRAEVFDRLSERLKMQTTLAKED